MTGDPNWADVVFLSGYEGGSVVDESPLAQTVTLYGTADKSSAQAKYGTQSLLNGTASGSQGASVPHNAAMNLGSGHYTIETFIRFGQDPGNGYLVIAAKMDYSNSFGCAWEWLLDYDLGRMKFNLASNPDFSGATTSLTTTGLSWSLNTWYHLAVDYDGTTLRCYIDGVMINSTTSPVANSATTSLLTVGFLLDGGFPSFRMLGAYFDETRVTVGTARYASDGGFAVPSGAFERGAESDLDVVVSESVEFADGLVQGYFAAIVESLSLPSTLSVLRAFGKTLSDTVRLRHEDVTAGRGYVVIAAETLNLTGTLGALRGVQVIERVRLTDTPVPAGIYLVALGDGVRLSDLPGVALPAAVVEELGLATVLAAAIGTIVLERLGLTETMAAIAKYHLTVDQRMRFADSIARFFGADVTEALALTSTLAGMASFPEIITEHLALSEVLAPQMLLHATVPEGLELTAAEAILALYSPVVSEVLELKVGMLLPDGSITTWAMNTRTGSVSEYDNFGFNSFARMGNRYLGASADGLYELLGDDDDGVDIVATLKGGFLQFGGTKLSRLKAAYIAVNGSEDEFVLRIETRDGLTYNYRTSTREGRSTKFHMGKGQRSRYFAWELESVGQDFDLDSLEFVPLVLERRV